MPVEMFDRREPRKITRFLVGAGIAQPRLRVEPAGDKPFLIRNTTRTHARVC